MRNYYHIQGADGTQVGLWANDEKEAKLKALNLRVIGDLVREEHEPRNPEGSMWFRGLLVVIALLFVYSIVTDERQVDAVQMVGVSK